MKKKIYLFSSLLLALVVVLILIFSVKPIKSTSKVHGSNYLQVYDMKNRKIHTFSGKKNMDRFLGNESGYQNLSKGRLPKNARANYKYVIHEKKYRTRITLTVYSNYKLAKVTGLPIVGSGLVKLTDREFEKFNHPSF